MARPSDLDPKAVARQFDRRARRGGGGDFLLREVERRMLERLDVVKRVPATVLDAGCGLGHGAASLQQRYPGALVVGVDLAPQAAAAAAALHGGRARRTLAGRLQSWFGAGTRSAAAPLFAAADTLRLPLRDASVDLVWSNLAWHWFADPPAVLAEWYRAIRPDGLLMFSAFGVDTLRELRRLGATLPEFPDMHDIGDAVAAAGFAEPVMDTERIAVTWSDPLALLAEVRALGGNASRSRARGLHGRGRRRQWIEALETLRGPDGRIALSLEVAYGHAWCPPRKRLPQGWAPVDFRPRRPQ
jgi:malonyl-CoA O-methyltransferase